jgi:hypothetical protein
MRDYSHYKFQNYYKIKKDIHLDTELIFKKKKNKFKIIIKINYFINKMFTLLFKKTFPILQEVQFVDTIEQLEQFKSHLSIHYVRLPSKI